MLSYQLSQASALPAVCAPVSGPLFAAGSVAHKLGVYEAVLPRLAASVGTGVPTGGAEGAGAGVSDTTKGAVLAGKRWTLTRPVQVQGTNGPALASAIVMDPVGGVRGAPPRGRPV